MKIQPILQGLTTAMLSTAALAQSSTTVPTITNALSNKPIEEPRIGQNTQQGCFNSSGGLELFVEDMPFNTDGLCGGYCKDKQKAVAATSGGQECWCGDEYPPENSLVDDSMCNIICPGFEDLPCGGLDIWSVYNTGVKLAVHHFKESTSTTTSDSVSQTSSVPPTNESSTGGNAPEEEESSNSKTVGIAVGIVVGVLVVGGIIGGVFWYMRRKRNQEIEEEHRRNAAVSAFINGSNPPGSSHGSISMTDSRLDPVMAHRRMSDGSIADNQDYSRKILRVTNA